MFFNDHDIYQEGIQNQFHRRDLYKDFIKIKANKRYNIP